MNLAELSIKRPIFITCLVAFMIILGLISYKKMPVDQFPDVTFPIVFAEILYPGASPIDVERQISKVIEDEVSSLPGIETVSSNNYDSVAIIIIKFRLGVDIKEAEQQVRNRISNIRNKLPTDAKEPTIRRFDPADQPILTIALNSKLGPADLYDVANEQVKPLLERVQDVGLVRIVGGQKKEIQVIVDKNKLQDRRLSMLQVSQKIEATSKDIPIGKFENPSSETVLRAVGEFGSLDQLKDVAVNFVGSDRPVKLSEIATIKESLEKAKRFSSINGDNALFLQAYKQSGANTVAVSDRLKKQIEIVNTILTEKKIDAKAVLVRDSSVPIRLNVLDVRESIFIGIILCVIVVFFFLGSARSTFITGLALPNSLLGGFVIMYAMGFSINIMTLIALSLAVGLLIDDAIVVRENIFRHLEMGKHPIQAALEGTKEVSLAVIATTMVVIAVFGPIAFVPGIVGQFFKQFGLTVVFTMLISLFDAFTVAPMLSAYLATKDEHHKGKGIIGKMLAVFDRFQTYLEDSYEKILRWTVIRRKTVLISAFVLFLVSMYSGKYISKTFLPANDLGEFSVSMELPVGTSIDGTHEFAKKIEATIKSLPEVELVALTVGSNTYESNKADFYVHLHDKKTRKGLTTTDVKTKLRKAFEVYKDQAVLAITEVDIGGGGQKPLNLYLVGDNLDELSKYALALQKKIAAIPGLIDVDTNFRSGSPEYHVVFDRDKSEALGVSTVNAGAELRNRTEGSVPAVYRQNGIDYDIRVMFPEEDKDLAKNFNNTFVPNQNMNMVPLSRVATAEKKIGYSQINRQNKGRFIAITANLGPKGQLGDATAQIDKLLTTDMKPPIGVTYKYEGQAQDFIDLIQNMAIAMGLGVLLIYLVLASLYESFITPFTILLALPLAVSGAFAGLLIFDKSIDIFSIIGLILLMGVVAKNSILLVDYTNHLLKEGLELNEALVKACRTRLRPILMTSLALIASTMPIAIGVTALGTQRQSMGVAIIGGVLSSTILTLVVVPAAFGYIEKFRVWSGAKIQKLRGAQV
ncbi:efflux RND transporter permease subunit [bacterium]|nr:efflux RND transporter permease subunit [bacterium]